MIILANAVFAAAGPAPPTPSNGGDRVLLARAESLLVGRMGDSALVLLAPAVQRARARHDAPLLAALLTQHGKTLTWLNRAGPAEDPLREAVDLADAGADSALRCESRRWLAAALSTQGRTAESVEVVKVMLPLARALGRRADEGQGVMMIAYHELLFGDPRLARPGYEAAIAIFREVGATFWEVWALNGLGRVHGALGDFEAERRAYVDVIDRSREAHNPLLETIGLNNLASVEFTIGDPGAALESWQQIRAIESGLGANRIEPTHNVALALMHLGRLSEAAAVLDTAMVLAESLGLLADRQSLEEQLAEVRNLEGRHVEAAALFRHVLEARETLSLKEQVEASIGLSFALEAADSVQGARMLLERLLATRGSGAKFDSRVELELALGRMEVATGRWDRAITRLTRLAEEARRAGLQTSHLGALIGIAHAQRSAGRIDAALEAYQQAARVWSAHRGIPRDPEWRERYGETAREIFTGLADLMLPRSVDVGAPDASEAARAVFDELQRFKARTLLERMHGPGRPLAPPEMIATAEALQSRVLEDNEVLIDTWVGNDASFAFAVTRDEMRFARLAPGAEVRRRLGLWRELLTSVARKDHGRVTVAALERTAAAIGTELFGAFDDLLKRHARVIIAPDGPLNLVPLDLLATRSTGAPLLEGHTVVTVPSATVLLHLRARPEPGRSATLRTLALLGATRPNGTPLGGARREADRLAARFAGVDRRSGTSFDPSAATLSAYDVVHVAAHTTVYDQRPWHSGIFLGGGAIESQRRYWRASDVAAMRLPARLVVLSGCESAGGRIVSGEGVLGLTAAFLSTGVPCVVATLWPVDDLATSRLMEAFYDAMAGGEDAAAALRTARHKVRSNPRWNHPFYWAGFVVAGEGGTRLSLVRRGPGLVRWLIPVAALLAAAGILAAWRRPRKPTPWPEDHSS